MLRMSLSHKHKVTARTSPQNARGIRDLVVRQAARGLKFGQRAIGIEGVMGCLLLDFLERSEEEQDAVIDRWLEVLENQVGEHEKEGSVHPGGRAVVAEPGIPPEPPATKRRSG